MSRGAAPIEYRLIWPAQALAAQGHDITVVLPGQRTNPGFEITGMLDGHGRLVDVRVPADADVVVMQRITFRQLAAAVPLLRAKGVAVVVDIDDDLAHIHPANPAFAALHPRTPGDHAWRWAQQACDAATMVTVSTDALLPRYAPHGRGRVLRNCIPQSYLDIPHTDSELVGWGGAVFSHPDDLQQVGSSVARLVRDGGRFRVVGPPDGARQALGLDREPESTGVVPIDRWPHALAQLGIGIAPLADTRFNAAKCIDSTMRITTDRGVVPAGEIEPGMKVWRDRWCRVVAVEHGEPAPGVKLTTEGGYELRLTPNHRMFVNGDWTPAERIVIGDSMAMEPEAVGPQEFVRVPWPADSRMTRREFGLRPDAFLTATDGPLLELTPRWGRFLGVFVGDGSCSQATKLAISCDGQDQDWIGTIMEDVREFGLHPSTEARKMYDGTVLRRRSVSVASAHLLRVLESLGLTRPRPSGRPIRVPCIPEVIWRSPREVIAEFLAGYFEADGTTNGTQVAATSKSEQLIRDIQRLLLLFGIVSTVRPRTARAQNGFTGEYWHITLNRAATDVFAKEIGFRSTRKSARLAEIVSRPHSNAYRPMRWSQKVVSVDPCTVTPVDIQVEGSVFIAAGFVSHNSWLKPAELSAAGVPWVASPRAEYRRLHSLGVGLLADRPRDWYRHLNRLTAEPALRQDMSDRGRQVAADLTIEGNAWRWAEVWAQAYQIQHQTTSAFVKA